MEVGGVTKGRTQFILENIWIMCISRIYFFTFFNMARCISLGGSIHSLNVLLDCYSLGSPVDVAGVTAFPRKEPSGLFSEGKKCSGVLQKMKNTVCMLSRPLWNILIIHVFGYSEHDWTTAHYTGSLGTRFQQQGTTPTKQTNKCKPPKMPVT